MLDEPSHTGGEHTVGNVAVNFLAGAMQKRRLVKALCAALPGLLLVDVDRIAVPQDHVI